MSTKGPLWACEDSCAVCTLHKDLTSKVLIVDLVDVNFMMPIFQQMAIKCLVLAR